MSECRPCTDSERGARSDVELRCERMISQRSPWAAALLSLPIPGLGHLYAGSARSAIWFGILTAPIASSLFLVAALAAPSPALFLLIASATIATTWVGV